jgi:hypothetical protein
MNKIAIPSVWGPGFELRTSRIWKKVVILTVAMEGTLDVVPVHFKTYTIRKSPTLRSSGQCSWPRNGDVLCFLWGTNWIYICYVEESRPTLWSSCQSSWLHNGDVLRFLWDTNWIYICYVEESRPPLWSSGQSSWLPNGYVTESTQPRECNLGATWKKK